MSQIGAICAVVVSIVIGAGCQSVEPSKSVKQSGDPTPEVAKPGEIVVADGRVDVQGSADGNQLELVLTRNDGTRTILASIPEKTPNRSGSFGSLHTVDCPPTTGLAQRYYVMGQQTFGSGRVRIEGLAGNPAQMTAGLYLIAITSNPVPPGAWEVFIAEQVTGGGVGSSLLDLPNSGHRTDAGCFYS